MLIYGFSKWKSLLSYPKRKKYTEQYSQILHVDVDTQRMKKYRKKLLLFNHLKQENTVMWITTSQITSHQITTSHKSSVIWWVYQFTTLTDRRPQIYCKTGGGRQPHGTNQAAVPHTHEARRRPRVWSEWRKERGINRPNEAAQREGERGSGVGPTGTVGQSSEEQGLVNKHGSLQTLSQEKHKPFSTTN